VRVKCDGGLPIEAEACDANEHCLEGTLGGEPAAECVPPVDCPPPGASVCANNSVYICSDVFPSVEADCGNGVCLATNGWPACYPTSDGPAPLTWQAVPGSSFAVGADVLGDTRPQATLGNFALLQTEVTTGQYMACVAAGACTRPADESLAGLTSAIGDVPIVGVTATEAKTFCSWAGGTLPTELEWEYAARNGGANVDYPWGDEAPTCASANVGIGDAGCAKGTLPGCSRAPDITAQGVCDLVGNVREWVLEVPDSAGMTGERGASYVDLTPPTQPGHAPDDDRGVLRGFRCVRH